MRAGDLLCMYTAHPGIRIPPSPPSPVTVYDSLNVTQSNITAAHTWLTAMANAATKRSMVRFLAHLPTCH